MAAKFEVLLGSEWKEFDVRASELLAEALRLGASTCQFQERGQDYIVDFASMTQQNVATGKVREVRVTFQDEAQARTLAELRANEAEEASARAAVAAAERAAQERREREAAEAAAAAEAERLALERAAEEAAAAESARREAEVAAEAARKEEAERAAAEEAAAAAAREAEEAAAAVAREAEEQRLREEAEAKARSLEGDRLAIGVRLDEEGVALQREGRLEEARQKLILASAVLRFVHRWDPRTKSAAVKEMLGTRIEQVGRRLEQVEDELRLPPLGSAASAARTLAAPAALPTEAPPVPIASTASKDARAAFSPAPAVAAA